jgi:hypothetical protein
MSETKPLSSIERRESLPSKRLMQSAELSIFLRTRVSGHAVTQCLTEMSDFLRITLYWAFLKMITFITCSVITLFLDDEIRRFSWYWCRHYFKEVYCCSKLMSTDFSDVHARTHWSSQGVYKLIQNLCE